ncbi:MAG: hypothetical protein LBD79_09785 [Treponema sp.]|jgi:hypothetical protein|nr:hypothetical protein [Treponema sp.]
MSETTNWFPGSRAEQRAIANTSINPLSLPTPPSFGAPQNVADRLAALAAQAENPLSWQSRARAPVITVQRQEDFDRLEGKMRFIKSRYLISLTDAELASLNLKPHSTRRIMNMKRLAGVARRYSSARRSIELIKPVAFVGSSTLVKEKIYDN